MSSGVKSTSKTLRFLKLNVNGTNGTNYHTWADNMKAALQAKLLRLKLCLLVKIRMKLLQRHCILVFLKFFS